MVTAEVELTVIHLATLCCCAAEGCYNVRWLLGAHLLIVYKIPEPYLHRKIDFISNTLGKYNVEKASHFGRRVDGKIANCSTQQNNGLM